MAGIEWAALPVIVEILGVEDVELLVRQLAGIRDHQNKQSNQ